MTVFEKIKSMSEEELTDWLASHFDYDGIAAPWDNFFNEEYCNKCECIKKETPVGRFYTTSYCEENKCCRFFPDAGVGGPDIKTTISIWLVSDEVNCFGNQRNN